METQVRTAPRARAGRFRSIEEYILHRKLAHAYDEAARHAVARDVLDLGCNHALGTVRLSEMAASVVGVDVAEKAIADAQRRFPNLELMITDGALLPFEDAAFDLVVSMHVIEHVVDQASHLADIRRVLRPQGVALFATPNAKTRLDPGMPPWNTTHVREFTPAELGRHLRRYFRHVKVLGLFADEPLFSIERSRLLHSRARAREALARSVADTSGNPRSRVRRRVKEMLPAPVVVAIRQVRAWLRTPRLRALPRELLDEYSAAQFFYRETGLDGALDLMAICRK